MNTIVLIANPLRDECLSITIKVRAILLRQGYTVVVAMPKGLEDYAKKFPEIQCANIEDCASSADLLICMGGDGTILHAAQIAARNNTPILGLNIGSKGFMAGLERDELELLENLSHESLICENRLMLDVELERDGNVIMTALALNDAVVTKGSVSKMINLFVTSDGAEVMRFSGDGVVVSTPTGSTAYSMSAGGPIVEPETANIILTPICAHALHIQPRVLSDRREVCVGFEQMRKERTAFLTVDGGTAVELKEEDIIRIRKSEYYTVLARLNGVSFFDKVEKKLNHQRQTRVTELFGFAGCAIRSTFKKVKK